MTRFARFGKRNKVAHDATQWTEMKTPGSNNQGTENIEVNRSENSGENGPSKSPLKGVKNDTTFKKHKNNKGDFTKGGSKFAGNVQKFQKRDRKDLSELECFNCHKKGHKVADCPEPSEGKQLDVECFSCNQKGHKASKCPEGQQKGQTKQNYVKFDKKKIKEWKAQRSENRREKRRADTLAKLHCYNCRETGHKLSECPALQKDVEQGTGICFKCGSTEHTVKKCNVRLAPGEYPYAKCFICGETGHLSQKCPDNPRGLYPNGGGCKECGSVEHLQRDCPEFQRQQGIGSITLERLVDEKSADQENEDKEVKIQKTQNKTPKVVKF